MKTTLTFLLAIIISSNLLGQTYPDCSHLTVENIQMDNDTANLMKISISNSCSTCSSGQSGCIYLELQVIKTVTPFDTIASSNCWCLVTPDNNSQRTYSLTSTVASLPSINDIRVSLYAGGCGCDTMPFSATLGILSNEISKSIYIFPNPAKDFISINTTGTNNLAYRLTDVQGKVWATEKLHSDNETISISDLAKGFYFIEIIDNTNIIVKTLKIAKD